MTGSPPAAQKPARAPTSLRRRLVLLAVACVASLLALEGAVRLRHWWKHGTFGAIYDFVLDEESGLRIPPSGRHGPIEIDSRGFRSPELTVPKPAGTLRVAFLGGSTTYCAEASGNDATWPAQVVARLRAALPKQTIDWVNGAAAAFTVEHMRKSLEFRVAKLQPDVIVLYEATNDLAQDSRAAAKAQGVWKGPAEDWLEDRSMLWAILKRNFLMRSSGAGTESSGHVTFDADAAGKVYEERVVDLIERSKQVAPVVAIATFSHRVRPEQDAAARREACQSALYYMPFMTPDDILAGITAYNAAIRRAAARTGALLIDGEHTIPADGEHFNDSVHLKDAGCRVMGERVATALLAEGVLAPVIR